MFILFAALIIFCAGIFITISTAAWVSRKSRTRPLALRVFFVLLTILPLVFLGNFLWNWNGPRDWTDARALVGAYQTEFGKPPSADVSEIKSRQIVIGDSARAWLSFKASPETISKLLERFTPSDKGTFDNAKLGETPPWWKPEDSKLVSFYTSDGWSTNFAHSRALLGIDASKQIVYFCHETSD